MLTVMKFGGSSVADLEHIRNVANRCIAKQREGSQVIGRWVAAGFAKRDDVGAGHGDRPDG